MKTITLKSDEEFFDRVTKLARRLHITKSELIREAVRSYERELRRRGLKKILQNESLDGREPLRSEIDLWEETLADGLDDDPKR